MFSYYQIHPTSINKTTGGPSSEDGVTANVSEMTNHQSIRSGYFSVYWHQIALQGASQASTTRILIFVFGFHCYYWYIYNLIYHNMSSNLCSQQLF
jgi:hypothetical protein